MKQKFLLDLTKHHKKQQPLIAEVCFFLIIIKKRKVRGKYAATLSIQVPCVVTVRPGTCF